jgi:hypothetical protein
MPNFIFLLIAYSSGALGASKTIYIEPGQCISIGKQEICAKTQSIKFDERIIQHFVCRFGLYDGSEIPDLKSYQLVKILVMTDGTKSEINLSNFGPSGKDKCEAEAQRQASLKR